jgi:hypothetical protein
MFRPRTPPRDYDYGNNEGVPRKERLSRKDEYEMRRNRRKIDKTDKSPPKMMYRRLANCGYIGLGYGYGYGPLIIGGGEKNLGLTIGGGGGG